MPRLGGAPGSGSIAVEVRFTGTRHGDMADPSGADPVVAARRRAVVDRPWTWLRQVHGTRVVVVDEPGRAAGAEADAAVSSHGGAVLAVLVADCAPVALASREGVFGVAHAGWRGLLGGVIGATVDAMRGLGATEVCAALGPCIHPECYRFDEADLAPLVARFGPEVRSRTEDGQPALDLPAAVRAALRSAGVALAWDEQRCTACGPGLWSWRARRDVARQAVAVWRP